MTKLIYHLTDITRNFSEHYAKRGQELYQRHVVQQLEISNEGHRLTAQVQETPTTQYHVVITVDAQQTQVILSGQCDCALGFNCPHVIAVLYQGLQEQLASNDETRTQRWLHDMDRALVVQPVQEGPALLYVLSLKERCLHVTLVWGSALKKGGYGKVQAFTAHKELRYLPPLDQNLVNALQRYGQREQLGEYRLEGHHLQHLIEQVVVTGRAFWASVQSQPLTLGSERDVHYEWKTVAQGMHQLSWHIPGCNAQMIPSIPPMYVDMSHYNVGVLRAPIRDDLIALLMDVPPFTDDQAETIKAALKQSQSLTSEDRGTAEQPWVQVTPVPHIRLQALAPQQLPVIDVSFDYWGQQVLADEPEKQLTILRANQVVHVMRDEAIERQTRQQLLKLGLESLPYSRGRYLWLGEDKEKQQQLTILCHIVDYLHKQAWPLHIDSDFPLQWVTGDVAWQGTVAYHTDQPDSVRLQVSVVLDDKPIDVLPILAQTLQPYQQALNEVVQKKLFSDDVFYVALADGRYLALPTRHVTSLLHIFPELWDSDNVKKDHFVLPKFRAGDLIRLEKALPISLAWPADKSLQTLARQLAKAHKKTPREQPRGLNATLRPYQVYGLQWLSTLTRYQCGGILADDMGLGKTIQTLALLLLEKEHGRLRHPSLIVAPTSLMTNWQYEAKKFAPDLQVLVLHGAHRKQQFAHIKEYDIVLTTYALLVRDEDALAEDMYQFLILDEAQIIKNPHAKASQVLTRLVAKQRFCLTGTPLENHLGELWSLFNFLLPGLLGSTKQFKRLFQVPIERWSEQARAAELAQRIAPFILRRTKDEVTPELPPKTEIIQPIALGEKQQALYDQVRKNVRLKVHDAIHAQGLERSHLVVLDALLRLRQICCDPRLAKMADDVDIHSAKLNLLLELVPNMIEEGRRILIFSSFSSMLDLIEEALKEHHIAHVKLTGKTKNRAHVINTFQEGRVPIFLISLKAGGFGLNLTAADTVIHYDPWWNPAAEQQATDRAHRIGQEKPVFVYKFITLGTVEEKIVALQAHKQALIDNLFEQQKSAGRLTLTDIENLLGPLE